MEVNVESPISLFSLFDKEDPVVKSIEKGIEISSTVSPTDALIIKLSLPEGAHLEEKISEETDESIVLIYNGDGFLMGAIYQAYITNEDGVSSKASFSLDGNDVICSSETNEPGTLVARIYIQRNWTYYFTDRGYNPSTAGAYHDFYMVINRLNFNTDIASGFSTFEMSWDAINKTMSNDLSSGDRNRWTSNLNKMYNQYKCHYNFRLQRETVWNLEDWRPDVSYVAVVSAGCNP